MSTMQKFKEYFGMAPAEAYEDDYLDEPRARRRERYDDFEATGGYDEYSEEYGYARESEFDRYPEPRFEQDEREADYRYGSRRLEPLPVRGGRGGAVRGALALDPRAEFLEESSSLQKITTLRPKDYSEARTIGERFREGSPVIMDLVSMPDAEAKRLVDFAAGLAFALHGNLDKVATKVFLLAPSDIDVTPEERRRLAETGFYNQK